MSKYEVPFEIAGLRGDIWAPLVNELQLAFDDLFKLIDPSDLPRFTLRGKLILVIGEGADDGDARYIP